ncbi:dentin matrix acidic phosphoprotein 1 [Platysternon megacephalum]|uniref:Dentin matrix acidic phosphoprotein 1 n=1 Tax=Platysternon megacephalum TaxID=55544 RepID=A0A4D9E057_9SAUR|nr:dentin matrix acidic phosphoprotein 1 [Platysternon megacephalum]
MEDGLQRAGNAGEREKQTDKLAETGQVADGESGEEKDAARSLAPKGSLFIAGSHWVHHTEDAISPAERAQRSACGIATQQSSGSSTVLPMSPLPLRTLNCISVRWHWELANAAPERPGAIWSGGRGSLNGTRDRMQRLHGIN